MFAKIVSKINKSVTINEKVTYDLLKVTGLMKAKFEDFGLIESDRLTTLSIP